MEGQGAAAGAGVTLMDEARAMPASPVEAPSGKNAAGENFPVGSFLIRRDLRIHVHTFYRFARTADDIADSGELAAEEKLRRLDRMEAVLDGADGDDALSARAMRASLAETGVTAQHCRDVLRAFRLDATKLRYENWNELMEYCRYSASPVGRQLIDLHGENQAAYVPSDALCSALQMLNHLQDCADDHRALDRVYLPRSVLAATGGTIDDLTRPALTLGLRQTIDRLLDATDRLIETAQGLPSAVRSAGLRCESAVIVKLAQLLSRRLRRGDPLATRVKLSGGDFGAALVGGLWRGLVAGLRR
jgi:squalene synthase HpnC